MTNIVSVTVMSLLGQKKDKDQLIKAIIKDLYWNPLLFGVLVGVAVNLYGFSPLPILNDAASLLGAAALPMMLVNVGANIRLDIMVVKKMPTLAAVIGKMILFPLAAIITIQTGLAFFTIPIILIIVQNILV